MEYFVEPETLLNDDDAQLAWDVIEPLWDQLPLHSYEALSQFMSEISEGQSALIAIDMCQKMIRNEGIEQLLVSTVGYLVPWAKAGFALIGGQKYESIFDEIMATYDLRGARSEETMRAAYDRLNNDQKERLEKLEGTFIKLLWSKDDDLEKYRGSFVRNNPDQFVAVRQDDKSMDINDVNKSIKALIDSWSDKRNIIALKWLLPAWPHNGLTDGLAELKLSLENTRAFAKDYLEEDEIEQISVLINALHKIIDLE